jgi:hypothetical protein
VSDVSLSQEVGIVEDYDSIQEALTLEKDCFASIKKVLHPHALILFSDDI